MHPVRTLGDCKQGSALSGSCRAPWEVQSVFTSMCSLSECESCTSVSISEFSVVVVMSGGCEWAV